MSPFLNALNGELHKLHMSVIAASLTLVGLADLPEIQSKVKIFKKIYI
jgi:hypothetical protein